MKELLELHNGDFVLWSEERYGFKYYCVGIEGYIGYKRLDQFIGLYRLFLVELHNYLIENNYPKTEKTTWIYQKRAIKVDCVNDFYCIFLDGYESTQIWDTCYYLEDVIDQLREIEI
ncbi:hypothetical protein [Oceanobacillus sp. FSL H7-0719]|uniref:hypothetical protein n=1 Tax=Oceanobacillus sp. FSL H7-0719 TaxID=2954507 RepID=UPI00324D0A10